MTRSGFVALAGRPNAGKSTLVNRIVGRQGGDRLRQAADHAPRDPRHRHRRRTGSSCWSTCPGVQRPRDPLTERMQRRVESVLADSDAVAVRAQRRAADRRRRPLHRGRDRNVGVPAVTALNKVDRLDQPRTVTALERRRRRSACRARSSRSAPAAAPALDAARRRTSYRCSRRGRSSTRREDKSDLRRAGPHRRAGARAGAAAHARGAAARGRGRDRRDGGARGRPARDPRPRVGGDRVAEGHPGRRRRAHGQGGRAPRRARRSRACSAAASTWTCSVRVRKGWRRDEALLDRLGIE